MNWLFDSSLFNPRSTCGTGWTYNLILMNQFGNGLIAVSYFAISICLSILWWKVRAFLASPYILLYFAMFIFLCGCTHLNNIIAFYYPMYYFFTLMDNITGVVSFVTALILPVIAMKFIKTYKTFDDRLEHINTQMRKLESYLKD